MILQEESSEEATKRFKAALSPISPQSFLVNAHNSHSIADEYSSIPSTSMSTSLLSPLTKYLNTPPAVF